jgi:RNA polymerase sigma factor (sigma-70 family)
MMEGKLHSQEPTMSTAQARTVLHELRKLTGGRCTDLGRDQELLQRFVRQGDESAFGELVKKHGSLVLAVCRGVLGHHQDAEDAFQATFLVLARKASSIRKPGSLASWLYGVAYRLALKARARDVKQSTRLPAAAPQVNEATPLDDLTWRELREVLHEELDKLPDAYRGALLLCYWEGKTQEEAAQELGWKKGTLRDKLERARNLLRGRLARRGIPCSVVLPAAMLSNNAAQAAPGLLVGATARAATLFAQGGAAAGPALARAGLWAEELLKTMVAAKVKMATAVLLLAGTLAAGVMLLVAPALADHEPGPAGKPAPAASKKDLPPPVDLPAQIDQRRDPIPATALARIGSERFRHGGNVRALAFARDGSALASVGTDHTIRLWEPVTGKPLGALADPVAAANPFSRARWLFCVAFAPDGKTVAAGEFEPNWPVGAIHLWDPKTGKHLLTLRGHQRGVKALAFSPDSQTLASAGGDGAVRVWDAVTGKETGTLLGHQGTCQGVAFGRGGKSLASVADDGTLRLWDLSTGKERWRIEKQSGQTESMSIASDGKTIASAGNDKSVGLFDADTGKERRRLRLAAPAERVAFSRTGKIVAVTSSSGLIQLWDPALGRKLRDLQGAKWGIQSLAFGKDDKMLAACLTGADIVRRWDIATGKEIPPPAGHLSPIGFLVFTPDGKVLISGSWDWAIHKARYVGGTGAYRLWEAETGKELTTSWRTAALTHDGQLLTLARKTGDIIVVEARTGKERRRLKGHPGEVGSLAFAPNDKTLASAGVDNQVRIWDFATGRVVRALPQHLPADKGAAPNIFLQYSSDGKLLATGARGNNAVYLWDPTTGRQLRRLDHQSGVESILFAPDGQMLAAGDRNGMVTLWDAAQGRMVRQFGPHLGWVIGLAFSADGRTLAAGGWRTVRVWEIATGNERVKLFGHYGDVTALAFRPDGRALATGSNDTTILLWDLSRTGRRAGKDGATPAKPSAAELGRLCDDLGDEDAAKAWQAIWSLVSVPAETVPLLKSRLIVPRVSVDAKKLTALIADLDHDEFAERQRAEKELASLGPAAEAALRKTMEGTISAEVRARIVRLLKRLAPDAQSPERLRPLRALEVLELVGTPEASRVLETLGKGPPGNDITRQAQASLARLVKRSEGGAGKK